MRKTIFLKKAVSVSLAAVISISLAACGKGSDSSTESITAKEGELGAYEETLTCTLGRTTIANPKLPDGDTYEDNAYTRYLKEKLNVEIKDEFEANGEDYDRQVSLAIASGELPDIMRITSKDVLDELVENNLVEDLTDVYEEYASDYIKKMYESYDGRCFEAVTYDGRLMALPGTNNDTAPCDVFIRQDWLDKLNIKADQDGDGCLTVDELGEIAKAFVENDPGNTGNPVGLAFAPYLTSGDYDGSGYTMMAIASAYGAFPGSWLMDESGKVYNGLTTEGMKKALAKVAQWYEEGIVDSQFGTRTWDDITALLTNGQTGITFGPWHLPDWLLNNVRSMDEEAEFSVFTICDKEGKVNVIHNNAVNGYLVVRKGYSNPEVLMKMAILFMDEIENNEKLEEEAPEVNEYIKSVDDTAKPFQIGITASTSLTDNYSEIMSYVNGDTTIDGVKNAASKVIAESVKKYMEDPENAKVEDWCKYVSRTGGIGLIEKLTETEKFEWYSPVFYGTTETMKTNNADLDKLREESFVAIVTGTKSVDEFDDFVEQWNARGGEQITKEVQEEVDGK